MRENDSILEMYLFESSMLLDQLDEVLLQSEKNKILSDENINEIFRIMHTIKGSSAMMDFDALSHVSHKLEDLFYYVRENGLRDHYFEDAMDLVLEVSDFLKAEVEKIKNNEELTEENDTLTNKVINMLEKLKSESSEASSEASEEPSREEISAAATAPDYATYHLHTHFTSDSQMENVRAFMLVTKLESLGNVLQTIPKDLNADPSATSIIAKNGFYCSISTEIPLEEIKKAALSFSAVERVKFIDHLPSEAKVNGPSENMDGSSTASITANDEAPFPPEKTTAGTAQNIRAKSKDSRQNLIAVDLNKLDDLMDLVGEIVITESMVTGSPDLEGLILENFAKAARQLGKLTDELQDIAMSIRMIPVSATFQKMHRIVRDMNKKLSRNVDLVLMGESTEVDKTIIDGIVDPLMHLVRNAMDHGIENTEERVNAKKDAHGRIILSAQNAGGEIIITVSDDGRGLDPEAILEKAKARNLLNKPEGEYTQREIFNLLTYPGFSTKESVTEFSGRGVGMDVVKKSIEKIGGNITIESVKGLGTTVLFRIPLTLSIIPCMEVKIGNEIYAIPMSNIQESFKPIREHIIKDPDDNEMILIRGVCYPIIRLNQIYDIKNSCTEIEDGVFMLVNSSDRTACLFADEILGKHRVVVKPLPVYFNQFDVSSMGISGCTILGDGSISLILDIQSILSRY